jgi:predicted LPLAT superfamily acyltransferase
VSISTTVELLGDCVYLLDGETRLSDHLGGTSRSENSDILLDKTLSQVQQTCLVIDRNNGDLLLGGHLGSLEKEAFGIGEGKRTKKRRG